VDDLFEGSNLTKPHGHAKGPIVFDGAAAAAVTSTTILATNHGQRLLSDNFLPTAFLLRSSRSEPNLYHDWPALCTGHQART
jgi:hypothetical protein